MAIRQIFTWLSLGVVITGIVALVINNLPEPNLDEWDIYKNDE